MGLGHSDIKYFNMAKKIASLSNFYRCHTGCIVVYKNDIISSGYNQTKTHPLQKKYNRERYKEDSTPHYMHAEVNALSSLINSNEDIDFNKVHIYLYRISNNNSYALAKPCPACMKLIKHMGIKHIHYTTDHGFAHEVIDYSKKVKLFC